MAQTPADLKEARLLKWSLALAERAAALNARETALSQREAEFERRVETFVDTKASEVAEALEIVRAAFPAGIVFPALGPGSGAVHRLPAPGSR